MTSAFDIAEAEACEMAAFEAFYRAAPRSLAAAAGIEIHRVAGSLVVVASTADVLALNRVLALGVHQAIGGDDLERIVSIFRLANATRFFAQVPPGPHQGRLASQLLELGFERYNCWVRLCRNLEELPKPTSSAVEVRQIGQAEARVFSEIVALSFDWPPAIADLVSHTVGLDGWAHYLAELDGQPVATGAFYVCEGLAWIDFAATLETSRGRGSQTALLDRRLADAKAMGCRGVVVEAAEPRADHDAPSYRNLLRLGFTEMYRRPNFLYRFGTAGEAA